MEKATVIFLNKDQTKKIAFTIEGDDGEYKISVEFDPALKKEDEEKPTGLYSNLAASFFDSIREGT